MLRSLQVCMYGSCALLLLTARAVSAARPTETFKPILSSGAIDTLEVLPDVSTTRIALALANTSTADSADITVSDCPNLGERTIVGFAVGSVNEEYARLPSGARCCGRCRLNLDRRLRFSHEVGETIDVMPESLQVCCASPYRPPCCF